MYSMLSAMAKCYERNRRGRDEVKERELFKTPRQRK